MANRSELLLNVAIAETTAAFTDCATMDDVWAVAVRCVDGLLGADAAGWYRSHEGSRFEMVRTPIGGLRSSSSPSLSGALSTAGPTRFDGFDEKSTAAWQEPGDAESLAMLFADHHLGEGWLVPVASRGRTLGLLLVARPHGGSTFSRDDLVQARHIAGCVALALEPQRLVRQGELLEGPAAVPGALNRGLLDAIPGPTALLDANGCISAVNRAWRYSALVRGGTDATCGIGANYLTVCTASVEAGDQVAAEALAGLSAVLRAESSAFSIDYECSDEDVAWFSMRAYPVEGGGAVVSHHDISKSRAAADEIARIATVDGVTGLRNRSSLTRQLDETLLARDERSGTRTGVLFVDIARFRIINDSLGHGVGDEVLMHVAQRLGGAVGDDDYLGRFGGDVFVVVAERSGRAEFGDLAARINTAVARPLIVHGRELILATSIGIALTSARCDAESALAVADDAVHSAKIQVVGHVSFIDVVETCVGHALDAELELRSAIHGGELELEYQAVVDPNGRIACGFEALVRWNHPQRGRIFPDSFIQLAEDSGLIVPLGAWVLDRAVATAKTWPDKLSVAVNLSPLQAAHPGLVDMVEDALSRYQFDPRRLILEVTESVMLGDAEMIEPIERVRAMGVQIAVDDFGTGYSSLSSLRRLPVDILKIDKSFIADLPGAGEPIVAAIMSLAGALGLDVIAEGVENQAQLDVLHRLGCRMVKGFHLHRPAPERDLAPALASVQPPQVQDAIHHQPEGIVMPKARTYDLDSHASEVITKRTLATLSHAVEAIAEAAGPDATVISLFQRGPYFARMSACYERMVDRGSTVVVAYAGDGPTAAGAHHVTLAEDHPLAAEWAIILITSGVAAHVRGEDLVDFDPTAADLESGRRFAASFGYDRQTATDHAERLIRELAPMMDPGVVDQVEEAIRTARHAPTSVPERSLSVAASVLANRLDRTQRELTDVSARLAVETELRRTIH